jgi:hypothetical protein
MAFVLYLLFWLIVYANWLYFIRFYFFPVEKKSLLDYFNCKEIEERNQKVFKKCNNSTYSTQAVLFSFIFAFCWKNLTYEFISLKKFRHICFFFFYDYYFLKICMLSSSIF